MVGRRRASEGREEVSKTCALTLTLSPGPNDSDAKRKERGIYAASPC
jgi:hypothetical protein